MLFSLICVFFLFFFLLLPHLSSTLFPYTTLFRSSIADLSLVEQFIDENGDRFIIEKWLTFDREISIVLTREDRKSTRLNSSHVAISYAVFCLKKKIEQ